jgi:hypothetical protein
LRDRVEERVPRTTELSSAKLDLVWPDSLTVTDPLAVRKGPRDTFADPDAVRSPSVVQYPGMVLDTGFGTYLRAAFAEMEG